jgi:hypothetical protein
MDFKTIRQQPVIYRIVRNQNDQDIHESIFRSFHILEKTEELLRKGIGNDILLEIIEDLKSKEQK